MRILRQPMGSSKCGQTCVAMILAHIYQSDQSYLDAVVGLIGKRGTTTKMLVTGMDKLGITAGPRAVRFRAQTDLPECAILITRKVGVKGGNWHWVVYYNGAVYDPGWEIVLPYEEYLFAFGVQATSYVPVNLQPCI